MFKVTFGVYRDSQEVEHMCATHHTSHMLTHQLFRLYTSYKQSQCFFYYKCNLFNNIQQNKLISVIIITH